MSLSLGLGIVANFAASFTPLEASMSPEENLYIRKKTIFPWCKRKTLPTISLIKISGHFLAQNLDNLCWEDNNTKEVSDIWISKCLILRSLRFAAECIYASRFWIHIQCNFKRLSMQRFSFETFFSLAPQRYNSKVDQGTILFSIG